MLERLLALEELGRARTVALYAALGDEVPLETFAALCRERGARTVYPAEGNGVLALRQVTGEGVLARTPGGAFAEPPADAPCVAPAEVDAFLVPGLLFDRACRRLGRGGGHYDRLLARARPDAALVGICYADRVLDALPEDPWDVAMDVLVTERFVLRRARAGESR